jgi:tetratricopeptide (TPR) repeat protein
VQVALGDGRRLFARHFYTKADAYFHNGYYPSIYDRRSTTETLHLAAGTSAGALPHEEEEDFLGAPKDWIDRFGRHFFPTQHRHLGEKTDAGCAHGHTPGESCTPDHEHCEHGAHPAGGDEGSGEERELLPWLRAAASMDPERIETYLVASFWLRSKLHRDDAAEQFLREGLRANPNHCELLYELGRIYQENRKDNARARNILELAATQWQRQESGKKDPAVFVYAQILAALMQLEWDEKRYDRALEHVHALERVSPYHDGMKRWKDDIAAAKAAASR